jgi:hypothetical protein
MKLAPQPIIIHHAHLHYLRHRISASSDVIAAGAFAPALCGIKPYLYVMACNQA